MNTYAPSPRIEVVDALRGFAVLSIMLLHNIEHFDLYVFPQHLPAWLNTIDSAVWNTLFFLFSGKSYAIFALLFGLTFFLQSDNQNKKGKDFRIRFAWRLFLLLFLGLINSAFYQGDILSLYAGIGVTLIPVAKLKNKTVFIIALFLLVQPLEWFNVLTIYLAPNDMAPEKLSNYYFSQTGYLTGTSFVTTMLGNLSIGKLAVLFWSWENGRLLQISSLFMLGMILGRRGFFLSSEQNNSMWKKVLVLSAVCFFPLLYLRGAFSDWGLNVPVSEKLYTIFSSWSNFAFMLVLVSGFVLLYQQNYFERILKKLIPFGRMSLTNYIVQSVVGSYIYYGYGLGMYQYSGATTGVLIGTVLFTLQLWFCRWWLSKQKQGPLEYVWHRATWI